MPAWRLLFNPRHAIRGIAAGLIVVSLTIAGCSSDDDDPGVEPGLDGVSYVVAGIAGESGDVGDGGPATEALLYWPIDVAILPSGELVIVDWNNHRLRRIDSNGIIRPFIGIGRLGDTKTGPPDSLKFNHPTDFKIGPDGDYYVAAFHNWAVRKIDSVTGYATTPIGTGRGFSGDGGPASVAQFNLPGSLVFDQAGNLYITDQGNMRIRMVDSNGIVTTVAGSEFGFQDGVGANAQFGFEGDQATTGSGPRSGCIDISSDGLYLYVADTLNNRIRRIELGTGIVTTIAGTGATGYAGDGGSALSATMHGPSDVTCSANGDIYFSDRYNHVVRKIDTAGTITTVVGTGVKGSTPNGTPARETKLDNPLGLTF
ncbi:MAG: adhesin/invasin, partial [bacterium]